MRRNLKTCQRGFSLSEFLVASAIFLFVTMVAYTAFETSRETYKTGENRAEMQQRTRLSFELMLEEVRLAGFDFNRDGDQTPYPDHPDEQLEWLGEAAFAFRANLDYTNSESGRETAYELGPSDPDFGVECCPIVTTGNDEIIVYALRSEDASKNTDSIEFKVDTSIPRDAGWDPSDGSVAGEEAIEIANLDFSNDNPPYTLIRFHIDETGEVVQRPMADNVRSLNFTYKSATGDEFYCLSAEDDGSCATANQIPFDTLGGSDHLSGVDNLRRDGRAAVRRIHVEIVGMVEEDDRRYVDPDDELFPHRQKLRLETVVTPQNLGIQGAPDLNSEDTGIPQNVTLCGGQCNTIRVEWDAVDATGAYQVNFYTGGATDPFFSATTPGIAVPGSDPERVYAVYQASDHPGIADGQTLVATVQSRPSQDRLSDESPPSLPEALDDVTRLEAPMDVRATGYDPNASGWPLVGELGIPPLTGAPENDYSAKANAIVVSWVAPEYALDVTDQTDPADSWTTSELGGQPALDCDAEQADTDRDGSFDRERTRSREMRAGSRYLIFRSDEERFVPSNDNFLGEVPGETAVVDGRVYFEDRSYHEYESGIFKQTHAALANCETYYYRIRAVDACWPGGDPAALDDPHLSPFAPALNPDPYAQNSDDVSGLAPSLVNPAIPGFAVPKARPEPPTNVTYESLDLQTADGDGYDMLVSFDMSKRDTWMEPDPLGGPSLPAPEDVTIFGYKVFSHPTNPNFTLADALAGNNDVRLDKVIWVWDRAAGRVAHDDEDGDGNVDPEEDESWLDPADYGDPPSGLRVDLIDDSPRFYRMLAFSCHDEETVPDPTDPTAYDYSELTPAVQVPCTFGGGESSFIYQDIYDFDNSVTSHAYPELVDVIIVDAWLILTDPATGDRARSADPVPVDNAGIAYFDAAHIAALTNNFGNGHYFITTEMMDENGCVGFSDPSETEAVLPDCCLGAMTDPAHVPVGGSNRVTHDVQDICSAQTVQIERITLDAIKTGGSPKKYVEVKWGNEVIWADNKGALSPVIDRTNDPLLLAPGEDKRLTFTFNRQPDRVDLSITYDYHIAGAPGSCTFVSSL